MKTIFSSLFLLLFTSLAFAQIPAGYKVETVPLPRGAVSVLGICHNPDGTLAIATWEGEVWERKDGVWTKFAEDLMEPNGILYDPKEDAYYVGQKPELTRLVDSTRMALCDRYETVTDQFGISGEYHEYHFGPVMDSLGAKYASLNLGACGEFTVPDGKPFTKVVAICPTMHPGAAGSTARTARATSSRSLPDSVPPVALGSVRRMKYLSPTTRETGWQTVPFIMYGKEISMAIRFPARPCRLYKRKVLSQTASDFENPHPTGGLVSQEVIANSRAVQCGTPREGKFGPLPGRCFWATSANQLFPLRGGKSKWGYQGWCDFLRGLESGPVKMSFDPQGRLWSAQVGRGWFSKGGKRTAIQHAEWDGKTIPFALHSTSLTKSGFSVNFTQRIGKKMTPVVKSWSYHYYSTYGSDPVDEKELEVTNYQLSPDRKTVTFDVPLKPTGSMPFNFPAS